MGSGVLQKTTVTYHSLLLHQEMQLESLLLEEKAIHTFYAAMLQSSLGQSSSQIVKKSENVCCAQMSPHFNLFPGKTDLEFSVPKTKGTILTFISNRSKSKRLSWYGGAAEKHHGEWHMSEGTIDMEAYIGIVQRNILPSRWCLSWKLHVIISRQCQFSVSTTAWFRRDRVNVLDWIMPALILHVLQQRGFVEKDWMF